jgi:hypothetical protein
LEPETVTLLNGCPKEGTKLLKIGETYILNCVPATATATPELVNVTCTDDAVPGDAAAFVPVPITTTTVVALEH